MQYFRHLYLRPFGRCQSDALLCSPLGNFKAKIGKSGLTSRKLEGDGATPLGTYNLNCAFYRKDRIPFPGSGLRTTKIHSHLGWCDDPLSPIYNEVCTTTTQFSHETLYRNDHIYDVIIVLSHNANPRIRYRGSAIFFHLTHDKENFVNAKPTQGCVAISKKDMIHLLPFLSAKTKLHISYLRSPKMALPTRTWVAPNSMASS